MSGPDAVAHLQSMVSNDVEAIPSGGGAYALLLTPKARVISRPRGVQHPGRPRAGVPAGDARRRGRRPRPGPLPQEGRARGRRPAPSCGARPTVRSPRWRRRSGRIGSSSRRLPGTAPATGRWRVSRRASPGSAGSSGPTPCPPRPASSSGRSASPRAAIPARSRSRGCTTAGTPTAACAAWRSRATRPSLARRSPPRGGRSAASPRSPTRPELWPHRPRGHPPRDRGQAEGRCRRPGSGRPPAAIRLIGSDAVAVGLLLPVADLVGLARASRRRPRASSAMRSPRASGSRPARPRPSRRRRTVTASPSSVARTSPAWTK